MTHASGRYSNQMLLSAVITGACVGVTLGFPFWHGLLVSAASEPVAGLIERLLPGELAANLWPAAVLIGGFLWGWLMGRLNGVRLPWKWGVAGGLSLFVGLIAFTTYPISGFAYHFWPALPPHLKFDIEFVVSCGLAAGIAGLALGIAAKNWRKIPALFLVNSLVVSFTTLVVIVGFELIDVRVGGGNAAMPKISTVGFLMAAIAGGAVMGRILAVERQPKAPDMTNEMP